MNKSDHSKQILISPFWWAVHLLTLSEAISDGTFIEAVLKLSNFLQFCNILLCNKGCQVAFLYNQSILSQSLHPSKVPVYVAKIYTVMANCAFKASVSLSI